MAVIHADGTEETRPRTEEEIAEIEDQNRIAAQTNIRSGKDRRKINSVPPYKMKIHGRDGEIIEAEFLGDRRKGSRRKILSDFERNMLMGEVK